jgi:hypothetical protein
MRHGGAPSRSTAGGWFVQSRIFPLDSSRDILAPIVGTVIADKVIAAS